MKELIAYKYGKSCDLYDNLLFKIFKSLYL